MKSGDWQPRINDEKAEILIYLFALLKDNSDAFLNAEFIEPRSRKDFLDTMEWFEKAYDRRKAIESFEQKWGAK